jgi:hypothetical protein
VRRHVHESTRDRRAVRVLLHGCPSGDDGDRNDLREHGESLPRLRASVRGDGDRRRDAHELGDRGNVLGHRDDVGPRLLPSRAGVRVVYAHEVGGPK